MSTVNGKKLVTFIVAVNWIYIICGTYSTVGYYSYRAGSLAGIGHGVQAFGETFNEMHAEKTNDTHDAGNTEFWTRYNNAVGVLNSMKDKIIMNGPITAAYFAYNTLMTFLQTIALQKADSGVLLLYITTTCNWIALVIGNCFCIGNILSMVTIDIPVALLELFIIVWTTVSNTAISYYLFNLAGAEIKTEEEKKEKPGPLKV